MRRANQLTSANVPIQPSNVNKALHWKLLRFGKGACVTLIPHIVVGGGWLNQAETLQCMTRCTKSYRAHRHTRTSRNASSLATSCSATLPRVSTTT